MNYLKSKINNVDSRAEEWIDKIYNLPEKINKMKSNLIGKNNKQKSNIKYDLFDEAFREINENVNYNPNTHKNQYKYEIEFLNKDNKINKKEVVPRYIFNRVNIRHGNVYSFTTNKKFNEEVRLKIQEKIEKRAEKYGINFIFTKELQIKKKVQIIGQINKNHINQKINEILTDSIFNFSLEKNKIIKKQTKLLNLLKNIHNHKNHYHKNSFIQLIHKISEALFKTLKTEDIHSIITLKRKINNNKNIDNEIKNKLIKEIDKKINQMIIDLINTTLSDNIQELVDLYKKVNEFLTDNKEKNEYRNISTNKINDLKKFKTRIETKINTLLNSKSKLNNLNLERLKNIEEELKFIKFNNLPNVKSKIDNLFRNIKIKKEEIYKKNLMNELKTILARKNLITNGKNTSSALTTTSSALTTTSSELTTTSSALTTNLKLDENNISYIIIYLNTLDKKNDLERLILNQLKRTRFGMNKFAQYTSLDRDFINFVKNYFNNLPITEMKLNTNLTIEKALNILGLKSKSTNNEIKKRYIKLALQHHPNKGGNQEIFKKISEAYEFISSN